MQQPQHSFDFFQILPNEINIKILSYLKGKDFVNACLTCKWINFIGDSKLLWRKEIAVLNISKETGIKAAIGEKISRLKQIADEGNKILNQKPKKDFELEKMLGEVSSQKSLEQKGILYNQYESALNQKFIFNNKLDKGFAAHLTLRKLGAQSTKILKKYASVAEEYYYGKKWFVLAHVFLKEGKFRSAFVICKHKLKNPLERKNLAEKLVQYEKQKNKSKQVQLPKN